MLSTEAQEIVQLLLSTGAAWGHSQCWEIIESWGPCEAKCIPRFTLQQGLPGWHVAEGYHPHIIVRGRCFFDTYIEVRQAVAALNVLHTQLDVAVGIGLILQKPSAA